MKVGDIWVGPMGDRDVRWRVSWVGTKKARLHAALEYGWCTATVYIDKTEASPDWRREKPKPRP